MGDLAKAADVIEDIGWNQGDYATREDQPGGGLKFTGCCAVGAINMAVFGHPDNWTAEGALLAFAEYLDGDGSFVEINDEAVEAAINLIATWNDAPHRTKEQVVDALRQADRSSGPWDRQTTVGAQVSVALDVMLDRKGSNLGPQTAPNPSAGKTHSFAAYRLEGDPGETVTMRDSQAVKDEIAAEDGE